MKIRRYYKRSDAAFEKMLKDRSIMTDTLEEAIQRCWGCRYLNRATIRCIRNSPYSAWRNRYRHFGCLTWEPRL